MNFRLKSVFSLVLALTLLMGTAILPASAASSLVNLYDGSQLTVGWVDGTNSSPDGGFRTTHYIPVAPGDKITFGAAVTGQGWHIVVYNQAKQYVSAGYLGNGVSILASIDDTTSIMSYTIPAGGAYLRVVIDAHYLNQYLITKNQPFDVADFNEYFNKPSGGQGGDKPVDPTNPLYGKTALFAGDSICYGQWDNEPRQGWAGRIGEAYGMKSVLNAGIGGTTLSCYHTDRIVDQLHRNKNKSFDYVILQGGTNDGWRNAPVGTVSKGFSLSDFDTDTFAGGLEELLYYALQYYPEAKIGFMTTFATPLGETQSLGRTGDMNEYYTAAVEICAKWGIPCLDLFHDRYVSNVLMKVKTYDCLRDPLHPNAKGYNNLSPYIGEWMTRLVDPATYKANPFINQRALFVGDSIAYGHFDTPQGYSWAGRLQDSLGIVSDNQACSGWSLSTIRGSQIVQMLQKNQHKQYDYVIMHGGINDSWDNAPVGVMTTAYNPDRFDRSTFAGALEHLFYSAYQYYPNARLGYIINFKMPAASSDMGVYRKVALEICEKWKVSCYDMYADDAVTKALQPQTLVNMVDVGHPNKKGYDILTPFIENWFKTIPYADISAFERRMPAIKDDGIVMPYEKNGVLHVCECDNLAGWNGAFNTELSLDKTDKAQGDAALVVHGTSSAADSNKLSETHYVGAMAFFTFPKAVDLSGYDTLAFDYYLSEDMTGKIGQLQLNFATNGEDGYNTLTTLNDLKAGWHTAVFGTDVAGFKVVDFDWSQINKLRYTWWNLNKSVPEMTIKLDHIRMYNAADMKQRAEDVAKMIEAIKAIGTVTADNYKAKEAVLVSAEKLAEELVAQYGEGVMQEVTNTVDLVRAREEYNRLLALEKEPKTVYGDVNADGKVNAADALQVLKAAVGKIALTAEQTKAADVNGDGKINAADALLILKKAVGKMDKFSVEK